MARLKMKIFSICVPLFQETDSRAMPSHSPGHRSKSEGMPLQLSTKTKLNIVELPLVLRGIKLSNDLPRHEQLQPDTTDGALTPALKGLCCHPELNVKCAAGIMVVRNS
jgi:hypothetical protein